MSIKVTSELFIQKSKNIYGDKYEYSKVNYVNNVTHVVITCKKHGDFKVLPIKFLNIKKSSINCIKCNIEERRTKFIEDAIEIHGDSYSYDTIKFTNLQTKIKIFCRKCNSHFDQTPTSHKQGWGCGKCSTYERNYNYWLTRISAQENLDKYEKTFGKVAEAESPKGGIGFNVE